MRSSFASRSGMLPLGLAVGIAAGACKTSASKPTELSPYTGEIQVRPPLLAASASFDATRVIGPTANLERIADGKWKGWIHDQGVVLTVQSGGKVSSPELEMTIEETSEGVSIRAIWLGSRPQGELISIKVTATELFVRAPPYRWSPVYLEVDGQPDWGREVNYGTGRYGGAVTFRGQAASLHPPEPQFALALLGAF